jgi:hypothetical protein
MNEMIGFIGLGNMGQAMANSLLKAGYPLTVFHRTLSKADVLTAKGACLERQPSEAVTKGGMVISMVANDQALQEIVESQGFLDHLGLGSIHLSMSTVSPETYRRSLHTFMHSTAASTSQPPSSDDLKQLSPSNSGSVWQAHSVRKSESNLSSRRSGRGSSTSVKTQVQLTLSSSVAIF